MILICPQCATRYRADEAEFPPAGRTVRCGNCRLHWHQPGFEPAPEPDTTIPRVTAASVAAIPPLIPPAAASTAPPAAQPPTKEVGNRKAYRLAYIALAAGWLGLITLLLLVALLVNHYRKDIAMMGPHSPFLQSSASHPLEMQGIDLRNVGYRREIDDGQTMLAISGTIANGADHELPLPKTIRVTLSDDNNNQLFYVAIPIPAKVPTLGPGQSVTFGTKIHDLPSTNLHLQMRLDD